MQTTCETPSKVSTVQCIRKMHLQIPRNWKNIYEMAIFNVALDSSVSRPDAKEEEIREKVKDFVRCATAHRNEHRILLAYFFPIWVTHFIALAARMCIFRHLRLLHVCFVCSVRSFCVANRDEHRTTNDFICLRTFFRHSISVRIEEKSI